MGKRLEWIDMLKGIGIIFVIMGHAKPVSRVSFYIYSFHMPLFFFLSGYMFSIARHPKLREFVKTRARQLLIPYFCFSVIALVILLTRSSVGNAPAFDWVGNAKDFILSKRSSLHYDYPIWFLTALFTIEVAYYLIRKYLHNPYLLAVVLFLIGYIGVVKLNCLTSPTNLPWSIDDSMFYIVFYGLGSLLRETSFEFQPRKVLAGALFLVYLALVLAFISIRLKPGLAFYFEQLLFGFTGTFAYFYIARCLPSIRYLKFLGQNTVTILSLHAVIGFLLTYKILSTFHFIVGKGHNLYDFVYTLGALMVLTPTILIINKYFPFILGKISLSKAGSKTIAA